MKLNDLKKKLKAEVETYVPDIINKVKPSSHDLPSYKDHLEIIEAPKKQTPFWTKRFALQLTSLVLMVVLSVSIIIGSLSPQEAVMSKEEFEEAMTELVNVEVNLWDYLPTVLSPQESGMPTSYMAMSVLSPIGRPASVGRPEMNENERLASRQLANIQNLIQAIDIEMKRINEFNDSRLSVLDKAKSEFNRKNGKAQLSFDVNNRRVEVLIESKNKVNLKATLPVATYELQLEQTNHIQKFKGSIVYQNGQQITFELSEEEQVISYVGLEQAKRLRFTNVDNMIIGEFLEFVVLNGSSQLTNKAMIQVDSNHTYVITDYPLLEEQTEADVYEIEVYDNETGDFILSKVVLGDLEVYRFDFDALSGFDTVTYHQIGAGVNARKEFRVDGVRFEDTNQYAIVHRALAIRTVGNSRFGVTRYVLIPYLLVEKSYFDVNGLPLPFVNGKVDIYDIIIKLEQLDVKYQIFMSEESSFES